MNRRDDARRVNFTFVSCQNVCQGAQNAYRRMIFEDERRPAERAPGEVVERGETPELERVLVEGKVPLSI